MKKIMCLLMLLLSIREATFAQQKTKAGSNEKLFETDNRRYFLRYWIALGRDNRIRLDLTDKSVLSSLLHMDSLLQVFSADIAPFKDSLSNELTIKRIDYKIDTTGRKEMRIQQFQPEGSSYVLNKGDLSALKLEQDTLFIYGPSFRITLFLNRLSDLTGLLNGTIDGKIATLYRSKNSDWVWGRESGAGLHLRPDPDITEIRPEEKWGNDNRPHDLIGLSAAVSIQNYKSYFVPSFNLSLNVQINNFDWKRGNSRYKYAFGAYWDPQFLFARTSGGLQTYRNDFIVAYFGYGLKDPTVGEKSPQIFDFSVGYLVGNRGGIYAPHTFRIGVGEVPLFKNVINIGPILYFNNFFKGLTPGLKITKTF